MTFKDHFSDRAARYAEFRPAYPRALVEYLAQVAPRTALAWDCACGSGQLSPLLAERFERVIATDASPAQLSHAAPHPQIEYRHALSEASGIASASVDLVVVAQAAHWFELPAFYAEARRVAREGAVIALVSYDRLTLDPPVDALIEHFYTHVVGPYWPPERKHTENAYRSFPFPFEELAPPHVSMPARWTLAQLVGYIGTWSSVRAIERAVGPAPFDAFKAELARVWGGPATARDLSWPLALRVGRVHASSRS